MTAPVLTHTASVEARIEAIADEMRGLTFRRGVTVKRLAIEWGMSEQRVRELSAEASKRVKAEIADPDGVTATVCTALERVLAEGLEVGDRKSVIEAGKTWAMIAGASAPTKVQVGASAAGITIEVVEAAAPGAGRPALGPGGGEEGAK